MKRSLGESSSSLHAPITLSAVPLLTGAGGKDNSPTSDDGAPKASDPLLMCSVCEKVVRKYCCPGCGIMTCSLLCVQQHKRSTGCNGRRDRTAFTPMSAYTEKNLRSDFHFLEDAALGVDRAKRARQRDNTEGRRWPKAANLNRVHKPKREKNSQQPIEVTAEQGNNNLSQGPIETMSMQPESVECRESCMQIDGGEKSEDIIQRGISEQEQQRVVTSEQKGHRFILASAATSKTLLPSDGVEFVGLVQQHAPSDKKLVRGASEHHVKLLLMPPGMNRHERNTSYLDSKTRILHWRIEWEFAHIENSSTVKHIVVTENAHHEETWSSLLGIHLDECATGKADLRHNLRYFCGAFGRACRKRYESGLEDYRVLLRKEPHPANDPRYYKINPYISIRESLQHKTLIENPVVAIILKKDFDFYNLVPPLITEIP